MFSKRTTVVSLLLALFGMGAVACSTGGALATRPPSPISAATLISVPTLVTTPLPVSTPSPISLTVTATDFKYSPALIRARAGQTIRLTFQNNGTVLHEFILDDRDFNAETKAEPGKSDTITFTPKRADTYKFVCTLPGHETAGMVGQLVVE